MNIGRRKTLTIQKAAEEVDVCERTIYSWIKDGKVEFILTPGGRKRIFIDTLWHQPEADELKGQKRK